MLQNLISKRVLRIFDSISQGSDVVSKLKPLVETHKLNEFQEQMKSIEKILKKLDKMSNITTQLKN